MERETLGNVLDAALKLGGDFAEVFIERKKVTGITCEDDKIERVVSGLDVGAGVRVISGENTAYAYTNDVSAEGLLKVAGVVGRAARGPKRDVVINLVRSPMWKFDVNQRPDHVPVEEKVSLVQDVNKAARRQDQRIKQVMVGYGDICQHVVIANSDGNLVEDERIRTRLALNVVAAQGGTIQTGFEAIGAFGGLDIFKDIEPVDLAAKAAGRAVMMLSARPAPTGRMPVVMAAEAGGTMVHEACGHGLEADLVQKQLSVYAGKRGQEVASPLVTVVDDATVPKKYGSFYYDDEGMRGEKTILIKDGILQDYMYDVLTARKEGRRSTGNGRRESYQERPIPRMTNTYIAPGKDDPEEIIRQVKHGLLVKKMGGGQVNTTTGDFVFDVAESYLIKDGEVVCPIRGATLTGNGPEVLRMVERIGSDLGYAIGTCGKDGQGVSVSDAQPTMMIRELLVGGTDAPTGINGQIRRL